MIMDHTHADDNIASSPMKVFPTTIYAEVMQLLNFTDAPASSRRCHHQPSYEFGCLSMEFTHSSLNF